MKILYKGVLALTLFVLQSALVTVALDVGGTDIGTVPFLLYANVIGAVTIFFVMYLIDGCRELLSLLNDPKRLVAIFTIGVLVAVVAEALLVIGTVQTNASVSGIVYRMYPLMIVALTPIFLRHRVNTKQLFGLLLGFAGAYIMLSNGTVISLSLTELPALAMLVGSAFIIAVTTLLIKKYNIGTLVFMEISALAGIIFFLPAAMILHIPLPFSLSVGTVLSLLFIGAIDFGIGGVLFYYSYKLFNTTLAGMASLAIPVLTVILAFLLMGTTMQPYYFSAIVLLAIGTLIQGKEIIKAPQYIPKQK